MVASAVMQQLGRGAWSTCCPDTTLGQYRYELERRLDIIMTTMSIGREGDMLRRRIGRDREHLTVFVIDRDIPPTKGFRAAMAGRHLCRIPVHVSMTKLIGDV